MDYTYVDSFFSQKVYLAHVHVIDFDWQVHRSPQGPVEGRDPGSPDQLPPWQGHPPHGDGQLSLHLPGGQGHQDRLQLWGLGAPAHGPIPVLQVCHWDASVWGMCNSVKVKVTLIYKCITH